MPCHKAKCVACGEQSDETEPGDGPMTRRPLRCCGDGGLAVLRSAGRAKEEVKQASERKRFPAPANLKALLISKLRAPPKHQANSEKPSQIHHSILRSLSNCASISY